MKKLMIATALLTCVSVWPAAAADMMCDEASITKMMADTNAMTDAAKKDATMKEMEMAKAAMEAKKMDECKMHMDNATKAMGG